MPTIRNRRDTLLMTIASASMLPVGRAISQDLSKASRADADVRTGEVVIRGVPIRYETHGRGTPVIMIHGFSVDHRSMVGCMEPTFARTPGYRRIYFDLPGMGGTPGSENVNGSDDMLEIVLAFIDALVPGQRFLLAGQSYGGYLARGVLARRFESISGIVLICPVVVADRSKRDVSKRTVLSRDDGLIATLARDDAELFTQTFVVQSRANWERFRDEFLPAIKAADELFLGRVNRKYSLSFDVDAMTTPFPRPALLVAGLQDAVVGYRDAGRIAGNFARGTVAVLDGAGHALAIEQSRVLDALLQDWLRRVEAEPSSASTAPSRSDGE